MDSLGVVSCSSVVESCFIMSLVLVLITFATTTTKTWCQTCMHRKEGKWLKGIGSVRVLPAVPIVHSQRIFKPGLLSLSIIINVFLFPSKLCITEWVNYISGWFWCGLGPFKYGLQLLFFFIGPPSNGIIKYFYKTSHFPLRSYLLIQIVQTNGWTGEPSN